MTSKFALGSQFANLYDDLACLLQRWNWQKFVRAVEVKSAGENIGTRQPLE